MYPIGAIVLQMGFMSGTLQSYSLIVTCLIVSITVWNIIQYNVHDSLGVWSGTHFYLQENHTRILNCAVLCSSILIFWSRVRLINCQQMHFNIEPMFIFTDRANVYIAVQQFLYCISESPLVPLNENARSNPLCRDNPPSIMTRGIAGSQVSIYWGQCVVFPRSCDARKNAPCDGDPWNNNWFTRLL